MMEIKECVFCNIEDNFRKEQVLYKGKYFYLVVPKGQIVEGFLIISAYSCHGENAIKSLARTKGEVFVELKKIINHVRKFYQYAYGIKNISYYEQGRGAVDNEVDDLNNFPIHSHICTLPSEYDFEDYMGNHYNEIMLPTLEELSQVKTHYLLLSYGNESKERICAYTAKSEEQEKELSHFRFKKVIAELLDCKDREQWRMCEGIDGELINKTIENYNHFIINNQNEKL